MPEEALSKLCKPIVRAFIACSITILGTLEPAAAQEVSSVSTIVQITGPASASPGEHVSFCYQSVKYNYTPQNPSQNPVEVGHSFAKDKPASATLRILDGITGEEKAKKQIMLPVSGSPALPSDPCVEFVVPALTSSLITSTSIAAPGATAHAIFLGVVSVSSEPVPPGAAPVSSLEVFLPVFGVPTNVRHVATSVTCPSADRACVF
jgi:hypothetical protein